MSNINVGFVDGRMCSRILKPPGGGYSEIFFTNDEATTPKKTPPTRTESKIESILKTENVQPEIAPRKTKSDRSSMKSILCDEIEENSKKSITIETKLEELKIEENTTTTSESVTVDDNNDQTDADDKKDNNDKEQETIVNEENNKTEEVIEPKTPEVEQHNKRRGRVPPGGFSSGLW